MRRFLVLSTALALSGTLLFAACAFPEFNYLGDDEASGGMGGTASVVGGFGGGGAPMTTTTTTTAGGEGGGGAPPLPCEAANLGLTGLCPGNQKCTVIDPSTGEVGCATAGSKLIWQLCVDDSDCQDGHFCDLNRNVCKPFCRNGDDCSAFGGECVFAEQADDGPPIPGGVKTCLSMCDPKTGAPCATTQSGTCIFIESSQFDCARSLGNNFQDTCNEQADCAARLACVSGYCDRWCAPVGQAYAGCIFNCGSLSPEIYFMGVEQGSCF